MPKKVQICKNDYFGVFFYILFVRKETEISTKKKPIDGFVFYVQQDFHKISPWMIFFQEFPTSGISTNESYIPTALPLFLFTR